MNKTFRSGQSLHRLIEDAPLEILLELLALRFPGAVADLRSWDRTGDSDVARLRAELSTCIGGLGVAQTRLADDEASRIVTLGSGRGAEALSRVAGSRLDAARHEEFEAQKDALGRSLWTFLHERPTFDDADSFQHATHFRNFGKIYAAFEVPAATGAGFQWTEALETALKSRIVQALGLQGACTLVHLEVQGESEEELSHVIILRHAGALSSVAEHRDDGGKGRLYYRPPNEATLIYMPAQGTVEVCAESPSVRQEVATCFAEAGLGQDLSSKPLAFRLYNLARLRTSLSLPFHEPAGFRVKEIGVVEADVPLGHPLRRLSLKVTLDDNIDAVAEKHLGLRNAFRRDSAPTRVVIAIRFWPEGQNRTKTLNLTLSHPNRCNLRSQANPGHRRLGYLLLEHWGIMTKLKVITPQDERALFPMLLELYDSGTDLLLEHELMSRGLDVARLAERGFIEPSGRLESLLVDDDDGGPDLAELHPGRDMDHAEFEDARGGTVLYPQALVRKFAVNRQWVEEVLLRQIHPTLASRSFARPVDGLVFLGNLPLDGGQVPCYFARGLGEPKRSNNLDIYLRGQSETGLGLILSAGREGPLCLGANVVVPLPDYLSSNPEGPLLAMEALAAAFRQNRHRARGGTVVELAEYGRQSATLYIPGKTPLDLTGEKQIKVMRQLVDAYRSGSPVVLTKDLLAGAGSRTPSQAFNNWQGIEGLYVERVGKRGGWKLAV